MTKPLRLIPKRKFVLRKPGDNVIAHVTRIKRPDYMGHANPEILFVVDPLVGGDEDSPLQPSRPITKSQLDFLTEMCKKHGIPIGKSAITWACPPVASEVWDSDKRRNDHIKVNREAFVDTVVAAKPKLIVALGKSSATAVLGRPAKITQIRGTPQFNEEFGTTVFPSLGVGHVIRMPENQRMFDADFQTLNKIIEAGYSNEYQSKIEQNYEWRTDISDLIARAEFGPLELSVDIEGVGLRYYDPASRVLCVQLCDRPGHAVAVPIDYNHQRHRAPINPATRSRCVSQLRTLLTHPNVSVFGQNFKFDYLFLKHKLGITIPPEQWTDDTICLMHGVDENMQQKSLDEIARQYVPDMAGYADEFNRDPVHLKKTRMDLVPPAKMLMYGCGDVDATFRAKLVLEEILKQDKANYRCYRRVVMPGLRAFAQIEHHGFLIDKPALQAFEKMLRKHQQSEYNAIRRMVPISIRREYLETHDKKDKVTGKLIKPASITRAAFLVAMIFQHRDGLRVTPKVFTKSTAKLNDLNARVPSTSGKMHLAYFEHDHEFISRIMEFIKNEKLLGTYVGTEDVEDGEGVKGFYKYLFNGRIRPTYLLHRTVTGRSASADPNGQNFPKRGKLAKKYREIFIAPPGHVLLEVDFSQLELRIAAIMSNDPTMLRLYREGADIHTATACAVMGITLAAFKELDPDTQSRKRFQAKAVNFGFLYGMGWRKFMNYARTDYGVTFTEEEAQQIRNTFFRLYRNLGSWHIAMREYVQEHGFVRAFDGRVRHLPSVYSPDEMISSGAERQAINSPVQAFGSDLGLMAMALIVKNVSGDLVQPIGFIHDAIVCIAKEENAIEAARTIKYWMENIPLDKWFKFKSPIPIIAEAAVGKNLSNMIEIPDAWYVADNISTWDDVKRETISSYEKKLSKAKEAGKKEADLPKHPFGEGAPQRQPIVKKRLVLYRKISHPKTVAAKLVIKPRKLILKRSA